MRKTIKALAVICLLFNFITPKKAQTELTDALASGSTGAIGFYILLWGAERVYSNSSWECWTRVGRCCKSLFTCGPCRREKPSIMHSFIPEELPGELIQLVELMGRGLHHQAQQTKDAIEELGTPTSPVFTYKFPSGIEFALASISPRDAEIAQAQFQRGDTVSLKTVQDFDTFQKAVYTRVGDRPEVQSFFDQTFSVQGKRKTRLQKLFDDRKVRLMIEKQDKFDVYYYFLGDMVRVENSYEFVPMYLITEKASNVSADSFSLLRDRFRRSARQSPSDAMQEDVPPPTPVARNFAAAASTSTSTSTESTPRSARTVGSTNVHIEPVPQGDYHPPSPAHEQLAREFDETSRVPALVMRAARRLQSVIAPRQSTLFRSDDHLSPQSHLTHRRHASTSGSGDDHV